MSGGHTGVDQIGLSVARELFALLRFVPARQLVHTPQVNKIKPSIIKL